MSLLAGVKFISKADRSASKEEKPEKKQKHSRDIVKKLVDAHQSKEKKKQSKKEKKEKSEKKSKQERKPAKKHSFRHSSSSSESDSDSEASVPPKGSGKMTKGRDSDESDVDMDQIADDLRKEERKEREEREKKRSRLERGDPYPAPSPTSDEDAHRNNYPFDPFRPPSPLLTAASVRLEKRGEEGKHLPSPPPSTGSAPPASAPSGAPPVSNKSAAELLRAKLLGKTPAPAPAPAPASASASASKPPSSSLSSFSDDLEVKRQLLLLKAQHKQRTAEGAQGQQGQDASQSLSLPSLLLGERLSRADDLDALAMRNVKKLGGRDRGGGGGEDDDPLERQISSLYASSSSSKKDKGQKNAEGMVRELRKQAGEVLRERQQRETMHRQCPRCPQAPSFPSSLLVSMGKYTYLSLKPPPFHLHPLHLELSPLEHTLSLLQSSEEAQEEVQRYLSCLQRMFEREGLPCLVVTETALQFQRHPHCLLDVLPLSLDQSLDAPLFFQQAFLSCDEEWAQHRKLIALSPDKPLQRAVPRHFPYLYMQMYGGKQEGRGKGGKGGEGGEGEGLVHPVERDEAMQRSFCYDVLAGMLGEEEYKMRRGQSRGVGRSGGREEEEETRKRLGRVKEAFAMYDWTQYIEEEA